MSTFRIIDSGVADRPTHPTVVVDGPDRTLPRSSDGLYTVYCPRCRWSTAVEDGILSASTQVMMHKLRACCHAAHVCVLPATRRWTPFGTLETVPVGACIDAGSCEWRGLPG